MQTKIQKFYIKNWKIWSKVFKKKEKKEKSKKNFEAKIRANFFFVKVTYKTLVQKGKVIFFGGGR